MRVLALLLAIVHVLVVGVARFTERADATVAAVHVEEEGTSIHHGHAEWCAVCTASQLAAPPPRPGSAVLPLSAGTSQSWRSLELPVPPATGLLWSRAPPA